MPAINLDTTRTGKGSARRLWRVAAYTILVIWAVICLAPIYWVIVTSLKGEYEITQGPFYLPFLDFTPTLKSWDFILFDPSEHLLARYFNSMIVSLSATVLTLLLGGMAVYGLTRFRQEMTASGLLAAALACFGGLFLALSSDVTARILILSTCVIAVAGLLRFGPRSVVTGNEGIIFALLSTRILPPIVVVLPLYLMAQGVGMLDTRTALVAAYATANLPVAMWLLQPVLGSRASEQEEAAVLDGASHFSILLTILLPMVKTGVLAAGLIVFTLCWNEYLLAAYLTGDNALTLPPFVVGQMSNKEAQIGGGAEEWAQLSVAAVLSAIPLLAVAILVQRALGRIAGTRR